MNHSIHNVDFFLNYGELLSSITETAIFQAAFSGKTLHLLKQFSPKPHVARGPHPITCLHLPTAFCNVLHGDYKDSNGGDKLSGITFGYYFLLLSGSGVQDASRPRAGPSPPDAINKSKRF